MDRTDVHTLVDTLYRQCFGSMLNMLVLSFTSLDFQEAEDILHETFSTAMLNWEHKGVPANPKGWIYTVSRNKAINALKRKNRLDKIIPEETLASVEDKSFDDTSLRDHTLMMLFASVHPELAPKTQMILTLKYVMNLKVEAIAKAFAMTVDGVDKILVRGREKIKSHNLSLHVPNDLKSRVPVINKIIYLIFNEGYKASYGNELIREELCEEALLLCKELLDTKTGDTDSMALYALMLFNSARFASRFDNDGHLVDLENQDRSLWNKDLIELGSYYLFKSKADSPTAFHLEASVAWLHSTAPSFKATDWKLIAALYFKMLSLHHNPFFEINYAIALYYAGEKQKALTLLNRLALHPFFGRYYLLNVAVGKFYKLEGDPVRAKEFLLKAMEQTQFDKEKEFIKRMLEGIR